MDTSKPLETTVSVKAPRWFGIDRIASVIEDNFANSEELASLHRKATKLKKELSDAYVKEIKKYTEKYRKEILRFTPGYIRVIGPHGKAVEIPVPASCPALPVPLPELPALTGSLVRSPEGGPTLTPCFFWGQKAPDDATDAVCDMLDGTDILYAYIDNIIEKNGFKGLVTDLSKPKGDICTYSVYPLCSLEDRGMAEFGEILQSYINDKVTALQTEADEDVYVTDSLMDSKFDDVSLMRVHQIWNDFVKENYGDLPEILKDKASYERLYSVSLNDGEEYWFAGRVLNAPFVKHSKKFSNEDMAELDLETCPIPGLKDLLTEICTKSKRISDTETDICEKMSLQWIRRNTPGIYKAVLDEESSMLTRMHIKILSHPPFSLLYPFLVRQEQE